MTAPFLTDPDFDLYVGDVRHVLAGLPDASVDCVVTSPPYGTLTNAYLGGIVDGDIVAHRERLYLRAKALNARGGDALYGAVHA